MRRAWSLSPPGLITAPSSTPWPRPACRSSRSTRVRRAASRRPPASSPRPIASTRRCSPAWGRSLRSSHVLARSKALAELKELHIAREALVKDRTAAKNRAKIRTLALLKRQNAQRLDQIERQIAAIDAAILAFIEANAELAKRFAILTSIPGVSQITAFALLIEMPELGTLEARQAASLAGHAPSRANPDAGPAAPSSAADGPASARPFTCPPSSPRASTLN